MTVGAGFWLVRQVRMSLGNIQDKNNKARKYANSNKYRKSPLGWWK
jgi:hypothetical protein